MSTLRLAAVLFSLLFVSPVRAEDPHEFCVLNQRSAMLTAEYWNPILNYVSEKSGVPLRLKMGHTAPETTAMTVRGECDFAYTNHLFTPKRAALGWHVIARPVSKGIQGAIVVAEDSPIHAIAELKGKEMGFPSREAFVGYWVPMDALLKAKIEVTPVFAGNQEGVMGQLKAGRVMAAAVNTKVMENYARREQFRYRAIWESETYQDLAVMVHPRIAEKSADAVRATLVGMSRDAAGLKILQTSAEVIKYEGEVGFVTASDKDYENYRRFYRETDLPLEDE